MLSTSHYVDGGRPIPASIQPDIGASFDDDPRYATEAVESAEEEDEATAEATLRHALLDPVDLSNTTTGRAEPVQDPLAQLEALLDAVGPAPMPTAPAPTARDVTVSPPPLGDGKHIMILAAIADRPDLVRAYLSMCQQANGKRPSQASEERPAQRRRYETPSDVIDLTEYQERRSKHAFTPTRVQQAIYGVLSSAAYKGKDAVAIVEAMISSRSTKFKPIPAIIIRIYAFEFGARGLSIMHFCRFDFAARRLWYASASVNFNNFSASVTLPTRPSSLDQVSNALTVLHLFVEEFMDVETCRLVSSSREFIEELRGFWQWGERDVQTLTFWFDSVFESFRSAAEYDSRCGTSSRSQIRNKLSLQDPDLQSVLYVIQSERLASMMPAHGRPAAPDSANRPDQQRHARSEGARPNPASRPTPRTPREVIDALPRRGRQTVCMKYLSAVGCSSKSDDRCAFPNHAHFIPDVLSPIVYKHIDENMGGVRAELRK